MAAVWSIKRMLLPVLLVLIAVTGRKVWTAGTLPPGRTFLDDDFNVHEGMIEAIAAIKVTLGCNIPDHYCPSDSVRRDQMASFLARALESRTR